MVKLALLWHMHQPYYEDLATGEHILPWVRLHALKDYWGMVALLDEFPGVRVTFNLVPSLLVQVQAFAEDRALDRHLLIGLKPAAALERDEREFLVANGFHAQFERMIGPFPRYLELHARRQRREPFGVGDLRDLQVLHKLVWVDPDWPDPRVQALFAKGRDYTEGDKLTLREIELAVLQAVIPAYRAAAESGRVELATSPFYHPILPLLCTTDVHFQAHPQSALPHGQFAWPQDALLQLQRAFSYHASVFGTPPRGVWPSEGSLSDEVIGLLGEVDAQWTATDEDLLARSLGRAVTPHDLFRPYAASGEANVRVLFREHRLSDRIGFDYQSWDAETAAADFVERVREAAAPFAPAADETPIVTVILDGENAWEHFAGGGRPFLRALYRRLSEASDIETVTMAEAARQPARTLPAVFPGSWINGDFYIWAGHRDDHRAWAMLADARRAFDIAADRLNAEDRGRALEELLIAEGSDWFWWYGDDHSSDHDRDFDELFRRHLRNVYRALGQAPPDVLHVTNITTDAVPANVVVLDRLLTRPPEGAGYRDWIGAAALPEVEAAGAMQRVTRTMIQGIQVQADRQHLYLRLEGPEFLDRLKLGNFELAVLVDRPLPRRVPLLPRSLDSDHHAAIATVAFADLGGQAGDVLGASVLVVDSRGHVLEQHPAAGPAEVRIPSRHVTAEHWVV
jgi:alpha-amylase/alpha-mannosidase (GH57 family)